jgi:TatD DNase family protein
MLIDSHCHLASHRFPTDELASLISNAQSVGVNRLVTLATSLDDVAQNLAAADHSCVHACIGIHPCDVHHAPDDAVEQLSKYVADPRVCAIGETGLDYYHDAPDGWDEQSYRARQRDFLRNHFEMAAKAKLNIVIHTRDKEGSQSFEDALSIYADYRSHVHAVFHCFIGLWENAQRVLDYGGLVSFGGVATFKNAQTVRDTAKQCPRGGFMIETDAPYLAPEPHRGKRNEPAYVHFTAERLAALREETFEELALHTTETADAFFRFR